MSPDGDYSVLYRFRRVSDAGNPGQPESIVEGSDGNFYVTAVGTRQPGLWAIFRITPSGVRSALYEFTGQSDGRGPSGPLIRLGDGRLYGTSALSGDDRQGSVFQLGLDGSFTSLYSFTGAADGTGPAAGLMQGADGSLYGATVSGGAGGAGVVFRLKAVSGPPVGAIDTPVPMAVVAGEVAFTGWAIDDSGIAGVDVYRSPEPGEPTQPNGLVYIGSTTMVEGARPDVVAAFPLYRGVSRAGWGLMILSNFLPNRGDGPVTLYAVARSLSGERHVIASRSILTFNTNSALPFGTLDTPGQGAIVSGWVVNFGWALTPLPKMIPVHGSTIDVYIDNVLVGHPSYGHFREDIAGLFPGYANSNGAVGYFAFDSRTLTNGPHTISWIVRDDAQATEGIGSRFFWVLNPR